jgi:hypothetical protein
LKKIFEDMINVYRLYTVFIQQQHKMDKTVKQMRQARRDILKLIQINIEKTRDFEDFNLSFLPTLTSLVDDYQQS